jgi:hypothetical protein
MMACHDIKSLRIKEKANHKSKNYLHLKIIEIFDQFLTKIVLRPYVKLQAVKMQVSP